MDSPPFSLLASRWLPIVRASGERDRIRPAELNVGGDDDPVIALDWPRPDLDVACREFLIGLLSTACSMQISEDWQDWWEQAPAAETLDLAFAPFAPAFVLDGPGPRFLQDLDQLDGEAAPVAALLINQPGANTIKKNADLFVRRGGVRTLSRAGVAMALFTLQAMAPAGGAGHRTSLRGGGPLTTLLLPPDLNSRPVPLWHQLWLNVFWDEEWADPKARMIDVFPWLSPTRTSEGKRTTTPADVHPAQAYWGMPRRIRLEFEPNAERYACDLTGLVDDVRVSGYRTRPSGNNYAAWSRAHPLTPYYRTKPSEPDWLPVHPQPGRLGYRDWVGLVIDGGDGSTRTPARAVVAARQRLHQVASNFRAARLHAAGYDMENMKARGFVESEMPVRLVARHAEIHDTLTRQLVAAARVAERVLSLSLRTALGDGQAADGGSRRQARDRFWDVTERPFHETARALADDLEGVQDEDSALDALRLQHRSAWRAELQRTSLVIFDSLVPMDAIEEQATERLVRARRDLTGSFLGFGKLGAELYAALGLPAPDAHPKPKHTRRAAA